jgi:hypothetical protein
MRTHQPGRQYRDRTRLIQTRAGHDGSAAALLARLDDRIDEVHKVIAQPHRNLFAHTRVVPLWDAAAARDLLHDGRGQSGGEALGQSRCTDGTRPLRIVIRARSDCQDGAVSDTSSRSPARYSLPRKVR